VGSFFADFLSVSDECCVEFASLELSPEKGHLNPTNPFASLPLSVWKAGQGKLPLFLPRNAGYEAFWAQNF
jgi:hypothetical protein